MRKSVGVFLILIGLVGCSYNKEPSFDLNTYEGRVTYFEYENSHDPNADFCMIGDSLTQYYDLNKYFPNLKTKNRGIAGDTTTSLLERLVKSINGINSGCTLLLIGANNVSTFQSDYELLVQKVIEYMPDTRLYLVSITPTSGAYQGYMPRIKENNEYIKTIAVKYSINYLNLFDCLLDESTSLLNVDYTIEGQHFNEMGYQVITEQISNICFN